MSSSKAKFNILSMVISVIASTGTFAASGQDANGNATPTADNTGANYTDHYLENDKNPYFKEGSNGIPLFVDPKGGVTGMEINGENYSSGDTASSGTFNNSVLEGNDYNVAVYEGNNVSSDETNNSFVTIAADGNGDPSKNVVVLYKNYADGVHIENAGSSMYIDSNYADNAQISNDQGYMLINQNSADNATIVNSGSSATMDVFNNSVVGANITNNDGGTINFTQNKAEGVTINNNEGTINIVGNTVTGATVDNKGTMNVTSCETYMDDCNAYKDSVVNADQSNITNSGTLNVSGAVYLSDSSFTNTGNANVTGTLLFDNSTLQNTGNVELSGDYLIQGGTFENDGVVTISGAFGYYSTTFNNRGTLNLLSNTDTVATSLLTNDGVINAGDNVIYSGNINNSGDMFFGEKNSTDASTTTIDGILVNNDNGTIHLAGEGSTQASTIDILYDLTNNGDIYLTNAFSGPSTSGNTLNINGNLEGDGNYYMQTQIANNSGDLISLTGAVNGNNTLFITDTGTNAPTGTEKLTVVKAGQEGTGSFALNGNTVDLGTYRYGLEKQGTDWALVNTASTPGSKQNRSLSTAANAAVGMHSATASMWEEELGTLMNRMGDLRLDNNRTGGLWVRQLSHEIHASPDSSRSYQQQYNGTQIGVDKAFSFDGGVFYLGAMTGVSRSTLDFKEGANGSIKSNTYGVYGTALFDNGYYLDTVAKYGHMKNKIDFYNNVGQKVKGDYKTEAYGLSIEGGKRFTFEKTWFIEPQLQLTASHLKGDKYSLNNGMEIKSDSMDLFNGRVGVIAGTKMTFDNVIAEPYIELSHIQELSGAGRVTTNNDRLGSDQIGTRNRYGAGINFNVAKQHNFFINASYENGSKMEQPWGVKAGYQFRF